MENNAVSIILMVNGNRINQLDIIVPDDQLDELANEFQPKTFDWFGKYDIDN